LVVPLETKAAEAPASRVIARTRSIRRAKVDSGSGKTGEPRGKDGGNRAPHAHAPTAATEPSN
jgi:hypothetical protein